MFNPGSAVRRNFPNRSMMATDCWSTLKKADMAIKKRMMDATSVITLPIDSILSMENLLISSVVRLSQWLGLYKEWMVASRGLLMLSQKLF
jgi:hypothetical protein